MIFLSNMDPNSKKRSAPVSWENVLASLEDAVLVMDLQGKFSFLNQAAETLTGVSASWVLQQSYSRIFKKNPWLVEMVRKSQSSEHGTVRGEGEFLSPHGHRIPMGLVASPLHDTQGLCRGGVLLMRDLTVRKEMEEDLKRSDRLALLGTLAAGLAHEIKNPLGGIKGAAQLLRREVARDPSLVQYTDIMIREVDRVDRLMKQLLDLSRPPKLNLESLNIHRLIDDVLLLEKSLVSEGDMLVRKNFDPSLPPIWGDRSQLTQVFLNLIKNALQAMNGESRLTLSTRIETNFHMREGERDRGKYIRVNIEDNGQGIKEEVLPHIFSPFFTTKSDGTGLGLAICHRIINDHGGLIRVESQEGQGTAFKVSLPMAD
jgi:two-component system nitrogen regulation sensor histidine kinase GlnL